MTLTLFILAVLVAFLFGMASFALVLYQRLFKRMLSGRPAYLTLPGSRPSSTVTYAVTAQGWRRLTPKGPSKRARRKARRRAKQAVKKGQSMLRGGATPAQVIRAIDESYETQKVE